MAGDWYVDSAANCASADGSAGAPYCTIAEALAVAVDGDAIHVAAGTYVENLVIAEDVTLIGTAGQDFTVIDGNRAGTVIDVATYAVVVIEGFTVRNGLAPEGSGIHVQPFATLDLLRSTVRDNAFEPATFDPEKGAGICLERISTLRMDECLITANEAFEDGGGIYGDRATIDVQRCTIESNFVGISPLSAGIAKGGGIHCRRGTLKVTDTFLSNNDAGRIDGGSGYGGSIYAFESDVVLERCEVRDSFANGNGGGHKSTDGTLAIADCLFEHNGACNGGGLSADSVVTGTIARSRFVRNVAADFGYPHGFFGGGLSLSGSFSMTVTDCEIADNLAFRAGGVATSGVSTFVRCRIVRNLVQSTDPVAGGLDALGGSTTLENCEVSGNAVVANFLQPVAGGIHAEAPMILRHCTIAGNTNRKTDGTPRGDGGGIFVESGVTVDLDHVVIAGNTSEDGPDIWGTVNSLGFNDVGDTTDATITGDTTGNQLDVDPLFADAANGDYSLSSTSPCIDAGDPTLTPTGKDLAGNPRLLDGDLDRSLVVDLGAHEFSHVRVAVTGSATPGGTITLDTSGTAGLSVLLFAGIGEAELAFPRYGALFIDLTLTWLLIPWGTIPSSVDVSIDPSFPAPATYYLQPLAIDLAARAGNFGNLVVVDIE